jgi:hypothetical protein
MVMSTEQRKSNARLGLILASVALAFFVGFVAKLVFIGK